MAAPNPDYQPCGAMGAAQDARTGGERGSPRHLPLEIVETIVAEAWKDNLDPEERRNLFIAIAEAHPAMADVILRVATRFVILSDIQHLEREKTGLYQEILALADLNHAGRHFSRETTLAESDQDLDRSGLFRNSHIRLDVSDSARLSEFSVLGVRRRAASQLILNTIFLGVTSVTIAFASSEWADIVANAGPLLNQMPFLTHLHLHRDTKVGPSEYSIVAPAAVFPSVTFLRTGFYPCCGGNPGHVPRCHQRAAAMFPNVTELELDSPLFLKYFAGFEKLEVLYLDAPPTMKPFCSILGYNIGAGIRHGILGKGADARRGRGWKFRKLVVRTGPERPSGWENAVEACREYGVDLVMEHVYY